jgi:hypothetical protein
MELDFDIKGDISGGGSAMGVGIAGKASGSAAATLTFCHPVSTGTNVADGIREALSSLVFPFEPDSALAMGVGDIGKVNFDASLNCELDLTYSFGSFKFSAPGVDSARQSMQAGLEKFSLPKVDVETGVKGTFTYVHSDHFGVIINKLDAQDARLYLVRSAANETGASVGITVGVSTSSSLNATVDRNALAQAVNKITGAGGDKVAAIADQLQSGLMSRANQWLSNQKGDMGLLAQLSLQTNRTLLFTFNVDLLRADLAKQSWEEFSRGDLRRAAGIGGMTLLPGSGVADELKRSVSVGLHFFNLFKMQDISTYFQNSSVELGPHGSVRFLFDVGKEREIDRQNAMQKSRIHFVATATEEARNNVQDAAVDLYIELSESRKAGDANRIADSIGSLPASQQVQGAQSAMRQFVASNKGGTLNLVAVLKPSAYQGLHAPNTRV